MSTSAELFLTTSYVASNLGSTSPPVAYETQLAPTPGGAPYAHPATPQTGIARSAPNRSFSDPIPPLARAAPYVFASAAIPTTTSGPAFDHDVFVSPNYSHGATSDSFVGIPETGSSGTISDAFVGFPGTSRSGPSFYHIVETVGLDAHGPSYDAFTAPGLSDKTGAVMDHNVEDIPPPVTFGDPDPQEADEERNRIVPDLVEFKSPNVYGLEKDLEGNVTGFKF